MAEHHRMASLLGVLTIIVCLAALVEVDAQSLPAAETTGDGCPASCDPDACAPTPVGCPAGLVKDRCGCCFVCGKTEGQHCDHPDLPAVPADKAAGKCGEHLECRLRDDVQEGAPEALCYCKLQGVVCGSDGITYESTCRLLERAIETQTRISVQSLSPCHNAPVITSAPENVKNVTKGTVTLACEATGYPIPAIEWTWTRVDGKTEFLPSDDPRITVNTRGGPERYQSTGWLQIWQLSKEHEGDYTCIAQNVNGTALAKARVNVVNGIDKQQVVGEHMKHLAGAQDKIKQKSLANLLKLR